MPKWVSMNQYWLVAGIKVADSFCFFYRLHIIIVMTLYRTVFTCSTLSSPMVSLCYVMCYNTTNAHNTIIWITYTNMLIVCCILTLYNDNVQNSPVLYVVQILYYPIKALLPSNTFTGQSPLQINTLYTCRC